MPTMTDVDEFAQLRAEEDPRTIAEMKAEDRYDEGTITDARLNDDGSWSLSWKDDDDLSLGCGCPAKEGVTIEAGDRIRIYSKGFGFSFHGIDINGVEMFWRTPWERFAERVRWLAQHDREKRERFVKDQQRLDAEYEALSAPLKARIDRFRQEQPDFRIDSESYEMYACVDADVIANHLRPQVEAGGDPAELVKAFHDLPWEEQYVIGLKKGHSGNTLGGACALARALLSGKSV